MTNQDMTKILAILKAAYPSSFKDLTKDEAMGIINLWTLHLKNIPVDIVSISINRLIAKSKFVPSISEVKQDLDNLYWDAYNKKQYGRTGHTKLTPEAEQRLNYILEVLDPYKQQGDILTTMLESPYLLK